jgi:hypothetical protein
MAIQITAEQQIDAIRKTAKEALKSRDSALKFLLEAGILEEKDLKKSSKKKKSKS